MPELDRSVQRGADAPACVGSNRCETTPMQVFGPSGQAPTCGSVPSGQTPVLVFRAAGLCVVSIIDSKNEGTGPAASPGDIETGDVGENVEAVGNAAKAIFGV